MKYVRIFLLGMIAAGTLLAFQNCGQAPDDSETLESSSVGPYDYLKPQVVTAPQTVNTNLLENLNLEVVVSGYQVTYQWYKGGNIIPGANNRILNIPSTALTDSGTYTLKARNRYGDATVDVVLNVTRGPTQNPPAITTAPSNQAFSYVLVSGFPVFNVINRTIDPVNLVDFEVLATGDDLTYQWYKLDAQGNAAIIPGATSYFYSFLITGVNQAGTYRVVVSNPFGSTMAQATLTSLR